MSRLDEASSCSKEAIENCERTLAMLFHGLGSRKTRFI